jgi:hypothetical protein
MSTRLGRLSPAERRKLRRQVILFYAFCRERYGFAAFSVSETCLSTSAGPDASPLSPVL